MRLRILVILQVSTHTISGFNDSKSLRDSQRAWVAWRDLEIKSLGKFYSKMDGTMYVPMAVYARMNLTRQRALALERLASLVDQRS